MRDILVQVTQTDPWDNAVRYASLLAASLHASLTGLYCREPGAAAIVATGPSAIASAPAPERAFEAAWAPDEAFQCHVASFGVKHGAWMVHEGNALPALAHASQWHDLLVLGCEGVKSSHPEVALARLELVSKVPCLLVPEACTSVLRPACVAVAWDGSLSSVRALHTAIPLLERAGRVVLLTGGRRGPVFVEPGLPSFDLDRYCKCHDLRAEHVALDEDWTGENLGRAALSARADMLVMAAHGHMQMSTRLFDDDTQYLIRHCPLPLLLRH